jgi:hypothetical protein
MINGAHVIVYSRDAEADKAFIRTARLAPLPSVLHRLGRSSFEGRVRARPPQDDGTWIESTGTRFSADFGPSQGPRIVLQYCRDAEKKGRQKPRREQPKRERPPWCTIDIAA